MRLPQSFNGRNGLRRAVAVMACLLWLAPAPAPAADLVAIDALGLRLARGFRITLWADATLANDIRSLTLDAQGRIVVSGPGYIRTLLDTDGNGTAETAREFAPLPSGAQGMYFDGPNLFCVGEGGLLLFTDRDRNGEADGPPQTLLPLETSGHGAWSIRKGPDGWLYVITGNDVTFDQNQVSLPASPVRTIEAGALLRIRPDGRGAECLAHGFHEPRDLDFNWMGDMFTFDGDAQADLFLPWYLPARLYHVGHAGHHGWRLRGWRRTWPRPAYFADTVDFLAPRGHAVPSGVVCYRHYQFPRIFRNGLFYCDWSSGRVYFTPLRPEGASYRAEPDVFLEPLGRFGFAPIDLAVAPDGALLVAAGGDRTRGSIYRIEYPPGRQEVAELDLLNLLTLDVLPALNAPQPLAAWSRAVWRETAENIGPRAFAEVVTDGRQLPSARVRAIEILTEQFGGLLPETAALAAQSPMPFVRARVAWSLGRFLPPNGERLLQSLARDVAPQVRRWALDAIVDRASDLDLRTRQYAIAANLARPEKALRQRAARLASRLPEPAWRVFWARQTEAEPAARLTATLAFLWRTRANTINLDAVQSALRVLAETKEPEQQLDAIRLIALALGDYRLEQPSLELYATYETAVDLEAYPQLVRQIQAGLHDIFPAADALVNWEAARLLAMLRDNDPATPPQLLRFITPQSPAPDDFHYLTVLSRLRAPLPTNAAPRIANAILSLDQKLQSRQNRPQLRWNDRLLELVQNLLSQEPRLANALLNNPKFSAPAHVGLVSVLGPEHFETAARHFLVEVKRNAKFGWSGPLIDVLSALPAREIRPLLRRQWGNPALRDDLILKLAHHPEAVDRDKFLAGLTSAQLRVARASLTALLQLPRSAARKGLLPALMLLRRLLQDPGQQALRVQTLAYLEKESGRKFNVPDAATSREALQRAYQPVFDWCGRRYPYLVRLLDRGVRENPGVWDLKLKSVMWHQGDPRKGEAIFRSKGCQLCHSTGASLGPPLTGISARYSPADLIRAVLFPNREVNEPYRSTTFLTVDKTSITGLVVSETTDSILIQTTATTTLRLKPAEVISAVKTTESIMPSGLLADLRLPDLADFYSFLKTL